MEQASSRGHEAIPRSGLGVGCKRCSSSKKLYGLSVRAQARRISTSLPFSAAGARRPLAAVGVAVTVVAAFAAIIFLVELFI